MKTQSTTLLIALLSLLIQGCATTGTLTPAQQTALVQSVSDIALAYTGNGQYVPVVNNLEGMAIPAWQGQPIAQGSDNAALGAAVAAVIPAKTSPATKAAILQAAAALVQAQSPATGASIQGNPPRKIATWNMTQATLYGVNGDVVPSLVKP